MATSQPSQAGSPIESIWWRTLPSLPPLPSALYVPQERAAAVDKQVKVVAAGMDATPAEGDFEALRHAMSCIFDVKTKAEALEFELDALQVAGPLYMPRAFCCSGAPQFGTHADCAPAHPSAPTPPLRVAGGRKLPVLARRGGGGLRRRG